MDKKERIEELKKELEELEHDEEIKELEKKKESILKKNRVIEGDCPYCSVNLRFSQSDNDAVETVCPKCKKEFSLKNVKNKVYEDDVVNKSMNTQEEEKKTSVSPILTVFGFICAFIGGFVIIGWLMSGGDSGVDKASQLDICLASASSTYISNWNSTCESEGKAADCQLTMVQAERWDKLHTEAKNDCYRRYGD